MAWADKPFFFSSVAVSRGSFCIFQYDCLLVHLEVVADTGIVVRKPALKICQLLPVEVTGYCVQKGQCCHLSYRPECKSCFLEKIFPSPSMLIFSCNVGSQGQAHHWSSPGGTRLFRPLRHVAAWIQKQRVSPVAAQLV